MAERDDDHPASKRQLAKQARRDAGDRSARVANVLMKLPASAIAKLALEEDLQDTVDRARAITSPIARRRAERALAGELRRVDLDEIEQRLANVQATGAAEPRLFHQAEQLREKLIEVGISAASEVPGGATDALQRLIDSARRERLTGRPPGAARALFRHVMAALKAPPAASTPSANDDGDDDPDDET